MTPAAGARSASDGDDVDTAVCPTCTALAANCAATTRGQAMLTAPQGLSYGNSPALGGRETKQGAGCEDNGR